MTTFPMTGRTTADGRVRDPFCPEHGHLASAYTSCSCGLADQQVSEDVERIAIALAASDHHDWDRLGAGHPLRNDYRRNAAAVVHLIDEVHARYQAVADRYQRTATNDAGLPSGAMWQSVVNAIRGAAS